MSKANNWRMARRRNTMVVNSFNYRYKKRERTQNWSTAEKTLLFELVKKYKDIVDNKSASLADKNKAWTSIHKTFLESCETERNVSRVKEQWGRMKALAKLEVSTYNAKVKTSGLEEAEKLKPSELNTHIWDFCCTDTKPKTDDNDSSIEGKVETTEATELPEQSVLEQSTPEENVPKANVTKYETIPDKKPDAEERISPTREIEIVEPQIKIENEAEIPSFNYTMTQDANSEEKVDNKKRQANVQVELVDTKRMKLPDTEKDKEDTAAAVGAQETPSISVLNSAKPQPRIFVRGNLLKQVSPLKPKPMQQNRTLRIIPPPNQNKKVTTPSPSAINSAVPLRLLLSKNVQHKVPPVITARTTVATVDHSQIEQKKKIELLDVQLECARVQKETAFVELKIAAMKRQALEKELAERSESQARMTGERGSGVGKGGGGGGSIREAGGSFGKMEAAHEDQYFYNMQKEQISKLREGLHDEISFHEEQIKRHQEAINRHKKRMAEMESTK
ncbi:uncharacterized protein LOC100122175 [Nasonia vitripennis]|uniref:Regulatory protein zeste n=1 Tax=Nasonia vitripennis TaxID=7425 RepID=A0A7M7TA91_NASVI|nr:uncharacterized protein LOC100122175 [Nasonia vitripennis]XP_031786461.1 uncharacterized protein LOC100122175 [Nasonia vitripennis]XP_031786462.1 uncharacterized protein LOC100122175 [Nasonia vitripennis]XP_032454813.1 uncharacterized protein LOC100122175 [Nasonia vitripennis]